MKKILKKFVNIVISLAIIGGIGYAVYFSGIKKDTYQAPKIIQASEIDNLEELIQKKTEERMKDPKFMEDTRKRARIDVVNAIYTRTETELYDYSEALQAEINGLSGKSVKK